MDYTQTTTWTMEQLQQAQRALHGEMKAINARRQVVDAELQRRSIAEAAIRKLAQMSPAERQAAAQMLGAPGIPSGEAVGTPGAREHA